MSKPPAKLVKPTLDKDLDKITLVEAATHQVARSFVSTATALLFLATAMTLAAAYAIDRPGTGVIVVAAAFAGYMAMNIGANDVTNNVGAAVGARAISMTTALVIAAIFEIAGAMLAGGEVVSTIAEGILDPAQVPNADALSYAMMAALLSAALWVNFATWIGAPVSTTHTIVGGVLGAGVAAAGFDAIHWQSMIGITASWMLSPLLGGVIAAALLAFLKEFVIYREDKISSARRWVPVMVGLMAGAFTNYLLLVGLGRMITLSFSVCLGIGIAVGFVTWAAAVPFVRHQSKGLDNRNQSLRKLFQLPLIGSAALLSFAHGANDVSNAIGPLAAIVKATQDNVVSGPAPLPLWILVIGAFGISVGLLLFGPRLIRLVGEQITKLNPMRAFCVALSAALTVLAASWLGLPVSSTHIAVGAVFGVGFFREWYTRNSRRRIEYMRMKADAWDIDEQEERNMDEVRRRYLVRRSHFMTIIGAWVITVPASAVLSAVVFAAMKLLFL